MGSFSLERSHVLHLLCRQQSTKATDYNQVEEPTVPYLLLQVVTEDVTGLRGGTEAQAELRICPTAAVRTEPPGACPMAHSRRPGLSLTGLKSCDPPPLGTGQGWASL